MAVQYSETQAIQVASELTRLDLDGWTYRPEPVIPEEVTVVDIHLAVVAVYDESGDFVDYLNMRLIPTELERMVPLKVTVTEEAQEKDGRDKDGGCPWCGRDCPDAGKPEGCWYQGCPDFPHENPPQWWVE